ncbi:hypothetical protein FHU26_003301 [Clostridium beijerinckii]|nr:hypothetical protein [Clostridium beijerinckii]
MIKLASPDIGEEELDEIKKFLIQSIWCKEIK